MIFSIFVILIIIIVINGNNLTSYIAEYNLDLISIRIILLRYFILLLILLRQFSSNFHKNLFLIFIILNIRLIFSFSTNRIIMFYFFFEWSLIPIFFIIIGWGYQIERIKSRFYLLLYTLFASLPLLVFIILIINMYFSLSINLILLKIFSKSRTVYLIILLMSFLVKFPIFFFSSMVTQSSCRSPCWRINNLSGGFIKIRGVRNDSNNHIY